MITDDFDYLAPGGRSYTTTSGMIAKLNKRSRVLELASGKGEAACTLASKFGCKIEAYDIDPVVVEYSREKAKKLGLEDFIDFEVKDCRDLDFGTGFYDMILAEGGALTYLGREDAVAHCAELLKEGHCLAITDLIYLREEIPETVRDAYEEGVFEYLTEIKYREMLERNGFEIAHLSMLPQSAWDRYYMGMRRKIINGKDRFTKEFRDSMMREIDVYYNMGGMFSVGYVYVVARLAKNKKVRPAADGMRIPLMYGGATR